MVSQGLRPQQQERIQAPNGHDGEKHACPGGITLCFKKLSNLWSGQWTDHCGEKPRKGWMKQSSGLIALTSVFFHFLE